LIFVDAAAFVGQPPLSLFDRPYRFLRLTRYYA
jgi:hypothetical protein